MHHQGYRVYIWKFIHMISIAYLPGPKVPITDAASQYEKIEVKGLDVSIHKLTWQLTKVWVQTIQKANKEDTTLKLLMQEMI